MPVDPRGEDLKRYMEEDAGGPVVMLNLLKYRPGGADSYRAYSAALKDYLPSIEAEVLYAGDCSTSVVAPPNWSWDAVLVVRYPSRQAFSEMVRDPAYQAVTHLRTEALTEAVLQATVPWSPAAMAIHNRSAPPHAVVPIVVYEDVEHAVAWLTRTFGFVEKIRIGDHRAQLDTGGGAVIVADATHGRRPPAGSEGVTHSTMVRVHDIDAHYRAALASGAQIASEPADLPFGERQYSARDLAGHLWTFSQSVADVAPDDWGGVSISPW